MRITLEAILISALLLTSTVESSANVRPDAGTQRPLKVGLVLSGGGARGIAHVGVLKWFEENRIPVHQLAGTSIGGLVGALYAMGHRPEEIRDLLKSIEWGEWLSRGPAFRELAFRRKEDERAYQVQIELGLRQGVSLPLGLSTDHYIGLFFDRVALPYAGIQSFDELPIPYRAVATDYLKAESVVLKDGPLSTAMRATMSIPGVFPPTHRDGRVLVDGGLLDNIPTDVIREMNPDLVIAVDVGTQLGDLEAISSLSGILTQSVSVMTIGNDRRNLRLADIIIAPELGDHYLLDFTPVDKLIEIGYQAAAAKAAVLERFALDPAAWERHLAERAARRRTGSPTPESIEITGVKPSEERALRRELEDFVGRRIEGETLADFETALTRITGEGRYRSFDYRVAPSGGAGAETLLVNVRRKANAPPTLKFGLEIDGSEINAINFTIGGRLTLYDVGLAGSEWRNDIRLGFNNLLASEYYYPLGTHGFFVAPGAGYRAERRELFQGDARQAEYQIERAGFNLDLGLVTRRSQWRVGYEIGYLKAKIRSGVSPLPEVDGATRRARLLWAFDGQDNPTIPTSGLRAQGELRYFFATPGATAGFPQAEVRFSHFDRVTDDGSAFIAGSGGTSFGRENAGTQVFTLGGPFNLGAYDRDAFRGNQYLLVSAGYLHRIAQMPPLVGGRIYLGAWYDYGGAFGGVLENRTGNRYRHALSTGFLMDTLFGPLGLVGSWGEGGRGKIYFSIGRFF
jgi:NTE family protein